MLLDGPSITMAASTDPLAVADEVTAPINAKTKAVMMAPGTTECRAVNTVGSDDHPGWRE